MAEEAKIKINGNPKIPGASSASAMGYRNGSSPAYIILIVIAQYFIFFRAFTDNSEKALFLSIWPKSFQV
jgi:hypothetical protein